jgi:hypothetical protein
MLPSYSVCDSIEANKRLLALEQKRKGGCGF